jgi:hypothetical protein
MKIAWAADHETAFRANPIAMDDGWFLDDVTVTDALTVPAMISVDTKENLDIKQDWDVDSFGATCDCAPDDPEAWELPGAAEDLLLSHSGGIAGNTTMNWTAPSTLGGTGVLYDTIRAVVPGDFVSGAACVESSGPDTVTIDNVVPGPGSVHFFLVRAKHACGPGTLGKGMDGGPRTARECP